MDALQERNQLAQVSDRLENWKFQQAKDVWESLPDKFKSETLTETINALANMFGNSGWFVGDMGTIVGTTVKSLLRELDSII